MPLTNALNPSGNSNCSVVLQRRDRERSLCFSEIMTILMGFHQQRYRTFKPYYLDHVCVYWRQAFPKLVSYSRFISWLPSALLPLCTYLKQRLGRCSGISFLDSTSLKVCHNRRLHSHRVFEELAARGKTSVDGFLVSNCIEWSMTKGTGSIAC